MDMKFEKVMNQKSLPSRREVFKELTPYATPDTAIGVRLFVIDFGLVFIGIFGVIFAPWFVLKVILSIIAGIKLTSLLTLGHDAAHNTLTANRKLNRILALACFIPCIHNVRLWVWDHHLMHHPETNGEHYDSYVPFTKAEFDALPKSRQLLERVIRSPNFVGFGIHYLFGRMANVRIWPTSKVPARVRRSAWWHFAGLMAYAGGLVLLLANAPRFAPVTLSEALVLGGALPIFLFACLTGGSLYLMHTNTRIKWHRGVTARSGAYRPELEATHLTLPAFVSSAVHHVYAHSVHHAHAGIPCYRLLEAQLRFDDLMGPASICEPLSLRRTLRTMALCKLYDYDTHTWLDFNGNPTVKVDRAAPVVVLSR
jgi:omega-6 fatty acid desaturase (delta-12 desaturase)